MMEKIERWLNIIHYCLYRADYRRHMLSNKLNPFVLIGRIPAVKRKFEEQGTTHLDVVNKIWTDKRYGFSIMISGGVLPALLFFFFWAISVVFLGIIGYRFILDAYQIILFLIPSILLSYPFVLKDSKYLKYFKQFDKWTRREKWKYGLWTFVFAAGTIALWIYSFRFLPKT